MNRMLVIPAAIAVIGATAVVAVLVTRDGGSGGADVAAAGAGPHVWIDHPLSGSQFRLGQSVTIRWHASAAGGIRQVALHVNGERVALAEDFDHAAQIVTERHEWTPPAPGEYLIEVTGSGADGAAGAAARKRITVAGEPTPAAAPSASATATPAATPSASATRLPGESPTLLPADTPGVTPPATHPPASSTPVPPTVTPVPPTSTPTPVPDTTPPAAPYQVYPKGAFNLACPPDVTLRWLKPDDPSGIQSYTVELEKKLTADRWTYVVLGLSKDVSAVVDCGDAYRWRVRARDRAGNTGLYSAWAEFGIPLP